MDSIKPCPFCGSLKVEVVRTNEQACWIECDFESGGCGARTSSHKTRDGAIKRWNRRDTPTQYAEVTYDMDKEFSARIKQPPQKGAGDGA